MADKVPAKAEQIEFIIADLSRFSEREIRALAVNIDANLRANPPKGTPIDTGWASANWVPSVGEPSFLFGEQRDPTPAQVAARRAEGEKGLNAVLKWKLPDGPIFVTNNVPYIEKLNSAKTHSKQSPPGFVQAGIEQALVDTTLQSLDDRGRRGLRGREGMPRQ